MRKFITILCLLLTTLPIAYAQVKVSSGSSGIEFNVKRAFSRGNEVCIDLLITNMSNYDSIAFLLSSSKVYDDEGNEYTQNAIYKEGPATYGGKIDIPRDVPRKVRIVVSNVDEYASAFPLIQLEYEVYNPSSYGPKTLTIKNLPIIKE